MGAEILTQKLIRYGWQQDEEPQLMDEALLENTSHVFEDENEYTEITEFRLEGRVVHRGAHVRLKRNVAADGIAAMLG